MARLPVGVRPLLRLSYFGDAWRGGLTPQGFLTTNLILRLATVLGVATLARLEHERARLRALLGAAFSHTGVEDELPAAWGGPFAGPVWHLHAADTLLRGRHAS